MFEPGLLAGKRVLITGGGTGLGRSMGHRMAQLGARLVICGRRLDVLEETAAAFHAELGTEVAIHQCDIRDAGAVDAMIGTIWESGPLDILVNNAAANFIAQTEKLSFRAADAVLGTSLHGALYCTMATGRRWIERQRKGVILSILSLSTRTGRAFTVPSAMAKSGVLAMTRSLAVEWGPHGIRSVAIAPGLFPTRGAWDNLHPHERLKADDTIRPIPLGRYGEHHELANLACFLVSDGAGFINGEMVAIDGGGHLRTSGAEDLLRWTPEQWDALRSRRT